MATTTAYDPLYAPMQAAMRRLQRSHGTQVACVQQESYRRSLEDPRLRQILVRHHVDKQPLTAKEKFELNLHLFMIETGFYVRDGPRSSTRARDMSYAQATNRKPTTGLSKELVSGRPHASSVRPGILVLSKRGRGPWTTLLKATFKFQTSSSRFLQLPGEVRNAIYGLALIKPGGLEVARKDVKEITPLLQVCRQTRLEARPIFLQDNTFCFTLTTKTDVLELISWLHVNADQASKIKEIRLEFALTGCESEIVRRTTNDCIDASVLPGNLSVFMLRNRAPARLADICIRMDNILQELFQKLKQTFLPLTSITAPSASLPLHEDIDGTYLNALIKTFWARNVGRYVRNPDSRPYYAAKYKFPSLEDVRSAMPEQGISVDGLREVFGRHIWGRSADFEDLVDMAGEPHHSGSDLLIPRTLGGN